MQYGLNFPSSNIKSILEQNEKQQSGVRTWRQLFGGASLGYNAQTDAMTADYSSAMAQAYKTNFEQSQSIVGGGLSSGHTNQLLAMSRKELSDTYDTYVRNYSKNRQAAAEDYGTEVSAISTAMTERADNFKKYIDYAWKYASEELYGSTLGDNRLNYFKEKGLDWMLDDEEQLKTWEDISPLLVNRDTGEMTEQGRAYFDAMYNATPQGYLTSKGEKTRGFDKWLADTDEKLFDYMSNPDVFNYTFAGTNEGTLNTMLGRESRDWQYERPEYDLMQGSKEGEYDKFVTNIQDKVYNTLENKNREGIKSIGDIGSREKKAGGKTISYDEWFKFAEKVSTNENINTTDLSTIKESMSSYLSDYKKYAETEFDTFKSELKNLIGESYAAEFMKEYGEEVNKLYNTIERYDDKIERYSYGWYNTKRRELGYGPDTGEKEIKRLYLDEVLSKSEGIKNLGFDKAMSKLYDNLQAFIKKNADEISNKRKNTSGF